MNFGNTIRLNRIGTILVAGLILLLVYYAMSDRETRREERDVNVNLRLVLIGSIQAAVEGGIKVLEVYNSTKLNLKSKGLTKEGANNPVTDADMLSHCAMYYGLIHTFPHIQVISEEHSSEKACLTSHNLDLDPTVLHSRHELPDESVAAADITVWIDPLDATQEFTEKLVEYVTTMVCVAVKGVPTLGVIHFPFSGYTTWAWVGQHVPVKHAVPQGKIKVITSRSHKGDVSSVVRSALGKDVELVQAGGAGYKSIQVATGNASAYIHTTQIKKWDICAGDAVLRALGGKMTTLTGEDITYGADSDFINKRGLLATLTGHENLLLKLSGAVSFS